MYSESGLPPSIQLGLPSTSGYLVRPTWQCHASGAQSNQPSSPSGSLWASSRAALRSFVFFNPFFHFCPGGVAEDEPVAVDGVD